MGLLQRQAGSGSGAAHLSHGEEGLFDPAMKDDKGLYTR